MLTASSTKDNVFRISVILYLLLVDLVDQPPAASRGTLQDKFNIPIAKAISEEGRKSCTCLAVDANDKRGLDSIALGREDEVVLCLECQQESRQVTRLEVVFRTMFLHYQAFAG